MFALARMVVLFSAGLRTWAEDYSRGDVKLGAFSGTEREALMEAVHK